MFVPSLIPAHPSKGTLLDIPNRIVKPLFFVDVAKKDRRDVINYLDLFMRIANLPLKWLLEQPHRNQEQWPRNGSVLRFR